jgi:sortase A
MQSENSSLEPQTVLTSQKPSPLMWVTGLLLLLFLLLTLPVEAQEQGVITRVVAGTIGLDAPVEAVNWGEEQRDGESRRVWNLPLTAAGWYEDSALPGQGGNVVLLGHHNQGAEVFRKLDELEPGASITLYVGSRPIVYTVAQKLRLKDKGEPDDVRRENARWIAPINEERLTLVSDWPYESGTHKVVVVAWPNDPIELPTAAPTEAGVTVTVLPTPTAGKTATPTRTPRPTNTPVPTQTPTVAPSPTPVEQEPPSLSDNPLEMTDIVTLEDINPEALNSPPITRLVAPGIGLNTPVIDVGWQRVERDGAIRNVWQVADYAAGWHINSSKPGQQGNIVLSGHHNVSGQVFRYLVDLVTGDLITVYQGDEPHYYTVVDKVILKEKGEPPEVRQENAKWIGPINEERLTLVSCWPFHSNTHRLVVVAKPAPPPSRPLAVDPLSVERTAAAITYDTVPLPAGSTTGGPPRVAAPELTRIVAEAINLDVPVVEEGWKVIERDGEPRRVWSIPPYAAGWHKDSKLPGQGGNVVLSGYHNTQGQVFRYIVDLNQGDKITLYDGDRPFQYEVVDKLILKEKGEPEEVRRQNARWIGPIAEERVTLVTGWPYNANTHRVVVVARPVATP